MALLLVKDSEPFISWLRWLNWTNSTKPLNDSFRYEQQLVWDAILEEYKRLEKMYKSYFKDH
jgi:hypothetical protein